MENIKVYILIDSNNRIIAVDADWNIADLSDWILIDEGMGDKYYNAQSKYFDKPLIDMQGCHNYIYEDEAVRETTDKEKAIELASFPTLEPTEIEKLKADIEYLSAMTGVII